MPNPTAAALVLASIVEPKPLSKAALARKIGVSAQAIVFWISGAAKPRPQHRRALFAELGIPIEDWDRLPKANARRLARKAA